MSASMPRARCTVRLPRRWCCPAAAGPTLAKVNTARPLALIAGPLTSPMMVLSHGTLFPFVPFEVHYIDPSWINLVGTANAFCGAVNAGFGGGSAHWVPESVRRRGALTRRMLPVSGATFRHRSARVAVSCEVWRWVG